jgi:hypothetical protein
LGGTNTRRAEDNTGWSPMTISPVSGFSSPATQRMVVVFPHPLGPSSVKIRPSGISKLTPSTAASRLRSVSNADGFAFTLEPGNKERVKQSISRHLRLEKAGELEEAYKEGVEGLTSNPVPSLDDGAMVLKLMAELEINKEAARLKPADIMDSSIVEKLSREGALDQLKKR